MNKAIILVNLLMLLSVSCKKKIEKPTYYNKKVDSLITVIQTAKDAKKIVHAKNRIDSLFLKNDGLNFINNESFEKIATFYFNRNFKKDYLKVSEKYRAISKKKNNQDGLALAYYSIGNYYHQKSRYDSSYYYFKKSEKFYKNVKNDIAEIFVTNIRAEILNFYKDYEGSQKLSIQSLKIAEANNFYFVKYSCYLTIGKSLVGLKNYKKAIEYFNKAFTQLEFLKNDANYDLLKAHVLISLSSVSLEAGNFEEAKQYAKQGLSINLNNDKYKSTQSYLKNNLGYANFKLKEGNPLKIFNETYAIGKSLQNIPIQAASTLYKGEYFLGIKDTVAAIANFNESLALTKNINVLEDELRILRFLAKANPKKAGFYNNRYISLNDSLQNVERATRDKFARIEFETEEIKAQKEEVSLQNDSLRLRIILLSAFALLILLLVVLLFKLQSNKAKTRELLLVQQQQKANEEIYQLMIAQQKKVEEGKQTEKQRISLELHDGVMGKLAAIRMNLYPLLMQANLVNSSDFYYKLDEIQSVEQEIRNIAHDLNTNLFSDNIGFVSIVEQLFAQIESHSNINFELLADDSVNWEVINNTIKINLFRILQEALQNIEKYAEAKKVIVAIKQEDHILFMSIADNGKGFDSTIKQSGIGLKNMKIRMLDCNGTFTLQSKPNEGTKINLTVPI